MGGSKGKSKTTRGVTVGRVMADALIEWVHLMYQKATARRVIDALIAKLKERRKEFE